MSRLKTVGSVFFLVLVSFFLLSILSPTRVHAGINEWTSFGPEGGSVYALSIDPSNPNILYAGGNGGVFKSTDGGGHWSTINTGLTNVNIATLAIDPLNPNILYAGTEGGGACKSTDGGGHWNGINNGLTIRWDAAYVVTFAVSPSNPDVLYAGTWGAGVFKSTDGGANWSAMNTGLTDTTYVYSLILDPSNANTIYAGIWGAGVFKSTDGGSNWSPMNTGLTNLYFSLAIDPLTPSTLYAAGAGVFKTTDGGAHWSALINTYVSALAIDPLSPTTLYAGTDNGVLKSTDGGAHWSETTTGLKTHFHTLAIDSLNPNALYAGTWDGVFKSTDAGENWSTTNTGLTLTTIRVLAIDPLNSDTLYAGTSANGVFKTIDKGANWSAMNTGLLAHAIVSALAIDPLTTDTIYAAIWADGIFKSTDGGAHWSSANKGLTTTDFGVLAIDPLSPKTIYAATAGVFKSTNGGAYWSAMNEGLGETGVYAMVINPLNSHILYAGTYGDGVFKSTYGGTYWAATNTGLSNLFVYALAIDPLDPDILYAGTERGGVFKSTDGGAHWNATNTGLTNTHITVLVINPLNPNILYAGTFGGGVFRSADGGDHWSTMNTGLTNPVVYAMAIDPLNPSTLYVGTSGGASEVEVSGNKIKLLAAAQETSPGTWFKYEIHQPDISVAPTSINFGDVKVGSSSDRAITVKNLGNVELTIGAISSPSPPFQKIADDCSGHTLAPSGACTITYRLSPSSGGSFSGNSTIASNDPDKNQIEVTLSGIGTAIVLQTPVYGEIFDSSSLIDTYQPSFEWTATGTFTKYTILFFLSSTDYGNPIYKASVKNTSSRWTPPIRIWKKIMTASNNNGVIGDIYRKVIGTKPDKTTIESDVWSFRVGNPQNVIINAPSEGSILSSVTPPVFNFNSNCNIKFLVQFSSVNGFSDPRKIRGFTFTTKDPNVETVINRTLSSSQWATVKKLIGSGTGYFRIEAWDGIKRETISEVKSFTIQ